MNCLPNPFTVIANLCMHPSIQPNILLLGTEKVHFCRKEDAMVVSWSGYILIHSFRNACRKMSMMTGFLFLIYQIFHRTYIVRCDRGQMFGGQVYARDIRILRRNGSRQPEWRASCGGDLHLTTHRGKCRTTRCQSATVNVQGQLATQVIV